MFDNKNCGSCKNPMDHEVKIMSAYIDGVPIYHRLCKTCEKRKWETILKKPPEIMEKYK